MRTLSLTPSRHKQLQAYVKCCARKERAIKTAGRFVTGVPDSVTMNFQTRTRVNRIAKKMRARGYEPYALAMMALRIARSKCQAELDGHGWTA
jgi:hypothetical protein